MELIEFTVTSGKAQLSATRAGDGAPVVFLHAGVADRRMWAADMEAAARTHLAVAYDRRGFGESLHADEVYTQVGDVLAVLDSLETGGPAVLVGCSQGGGIAIDTALACPQRIAGLVLIAPAISGAPSAELPAAAKSLFEEIDLAEAAGDLERVNELEARLWLDGPLASAHRITGPARDLFLQMNGIALRAEATGEERPPRPAFDRLAEIEVPTLIIWGDLDLPHLQARSRWLSQQIKGAQAQELSGVAHLPSLERPAETARLISDFLARIGAAR